MLARQLRGNMTDAERHLCARIRRKQLLGAQFYRQKNIRSYIVDFYCPSAKLIVELDGGQHYCDYGIRGDAKRDAYLEGLGFTALRFSNRDVLADTDAVLECLWEHLKVCCKGRESPCPPLQKGDDGASALRCPARPSQGGSFQFPPFLREVRGILELQLMPCPFLRHSGLPFIPRPRRRRGSPTQTAE
jgi:very-short-patch-repair endonuclease